ncbi:MAG: FG-GAP repeat protein, partial [Bacteroidetes bacterium]|nr:FG-GAP repeat protein [Bacteroidota bacterium]
MVQNEKAVPPRKNLFEMIPEDVTGIGFVNKLTENEKYNLTEYEYFYNGGGVGIGDVNNDGFDDVIVGALGADPGGRSQAGETYIFFSNGSLPS